MGVEEKGQWLRSGVTGGELRGEGEEVRSGVRSMVNIEKVILKEPI